MKSVLLTSALLFLINVAFSQNVILKFNTRGGTELNKAKSEVTYKFDLAGLETDNDAKEFHQKATKYTDVTEAYVHPYIKGGVRNATLTTTNMDNTVYMKGFFDYMGIKDLIINEEKVKTTDFVAFAKKLKEVNNK